MENGGEPRYPRPTDDEVRRAYHYLADVFTDAEVDVHGRRVIPQEEIGERLAASALVPADAAVPWAFHVGCQRGLFCHSVLKKAPVTALGRNAIEAKPRIVEVPAIAAPEPFWAEVRSRLPGKK